MTADQPQGGASRAARCVLFADVCDSSRLYRELGDERARAVIREALGLASMMVETEGGRVVDTIGDEVFCVLPDADAGLRVALGTHDRVAEARDRGVLPRGIGFRIGLAHGTIGLREEQVFGDTVYLAKRVSTEAKYEQILLTADTLASMAGPDSQRFRAVGSLRLKGRVEEVELIEALWGPDLTTEVAGLTAQLGQACALELVLAFEGESLIVSQAAPVATIGRGDHCRLIIADGRVSRLHAKVELVRGEFVWTDQSRNGSVINIAGLPPRSALRSQAALESTGTIQLGPSEDAPVISFHVRNATP